MDNEEASSSGRPSRAKRVNYKLLSKPIEFPAPLKLSKKQLNKLKKESKAKRARENELKKESKAKRAREIKEEPRGDNQDSGTTTAAEYEAHNDTHNDTVTMSDKHKSGTTTSTVQEVYNDMATMSDHSDIELEPPRSRNYAVDSGGIFTDHNYGMSSHPIWGQDTPDGETRVKPEIGEMEEEEHGGAGLQLSSAPTIQEDAVDYDDGQHEIIVKRELVGEEGEDWMQQVPTVKRYDTNKGPRFVQSTRQFGETNLNSCVHCDTKFKTILKGYRRVSVENVLPNSSSGLTALEQLEVLTGRNLTPADEHLGGRFLCHGCWSSLNMIAKTRHVLAKFFEKAAKTSYLTRPNGSSSSPGPSKRQRVDTTDTRAEQTGDGSMLRDVQTNFELFANHGVDERDLIIKQLREENDMLKNELDQLKHSKGMTPTTGNQQVRPPYQYQTTTKWDVIMTALRARHYRRAINNIFHATPATKKQFIIVAKRIARKEVRALLNVADFPLKQEFSSSEIQWLPWDKTLTQAEEAAPLLTGVLKGAITGRQNENTLSRGPQCNLKPKLCVALAVLLNCRAPKSCRFLQTLLSLQMSIGNLNRDTMMLMAKLGLCLFPRNSEIILNRIKSESDDATPCLLEDKGNCLISKMPTHNEKDEIVSHLLSALSKSTVDELESGLEEIGEQRVADNGYGEESTDPANEGEDEGDGRTMNERDGEECGLDMEVEEADDDDEEGADLE